MPRTADPRFAARLSTSVSITERQEVMDIARAERVDPAVVVRWAVIAYLARRAAEDAGTNGHTAP